MLSMWPESPEHCWDSTTPETTRDPSCRPLVEQDWASCKTLCLCFREACEHWPSVARLQSYLENGCTVCAWNAYKTIYAAYQEVLVFWGMFVTHPVHTTTAFAHEQCADLTLAQLLGCPADWYINEVVFFSMLSKGVLSNLGHFPLFLHHGCHLSHHRHPPQGHTKYTPPLLHASSPVGCWYPEIPTTLWLVILTSCVGCRL